MYVYVFITLGRVIQVVGFFNQRLLRQAFGAAFGFIVLLNIGLSQDYNNSVYLTKRN